MGTFSLSEHHLSYLQLILPFLVQMHTNSDKLYTNNLRLHVHIFIHAFNNIIVNIICLLYVYYIILYVVIMCKPIYKLHFNSVM